MPLEAGIPAPDFTLPDETGAHFFIDVKRRCLFGGMIEPGFTHRHADRRVNHRPSFLAAESACYNR